MNYSFTKRSEKSRKEIKQTLHVCTETQVGFKIFLHLVMRRFKKLLLLLLENFRMKNSILLHKIIDQTLSFIVITFF